MGYFAGRLSEIIHMLKCLIEEVFLNCTETAVRLPRLNMLEKSIRFSCAFLTDVFVNVALKMVKVF